MEDQRRLRRQAEPSPFEIDLRLDLEIRDDSSKDFAVAERSSKGPCLEAATAAVNFQIIPMIEYVEY